MQQDNENISINNITKLTWACRRGMLELDVLLGNFLKEAYAVLPDDDKLRFVELLTYSDPEILAWIMGSELPEDADLIRITELVRNHARSRV